MRKARGGVIGEFARHILGLHGWVALAVVFALPMLESAAFVGFVFPGEIAVILGGVLAYEHRVSLPAALAAAILGAICGDTVGYAVGRRFGRRLLYGSLGRFIRHRHLERGERYLAARGGPAVFFGRFTAALRVLIPGLAGISRMRYRTFLSFNVAGGVCWATGYVFVGYLAGASWQRAEHAASKIGVGLLVVLALVLAVAWLTRREGREHARAAATRLAASGPVAWLRRRFPGTTGWLGRRLDPRYPDGFVLTTMVVATGLCAWGFAGVTQDVLAHEEMVGYDPGVLAFLVAHRSAVLTTAMDVVTWLGSGFVLIPLLVAVSAAMLWRRDVRTVVETWVVYGGGVVSYAAAKSIVARPRPPAADALVDTTNWSFPSGHAVQAVAAWGTLAFLLAVRCRGRIRVVAPVGAAVVVAAVGFSRVYLGAHWLTDVLAGCALGGAWLAFVLALHLRHAGQVAEPSE
ncbi:MAG TPA: bifunctional DedA family/phosphatase PAP2 family protein [Streptosporangiales bacterium]